MTVSTADTVSVSLNYFSPPPDGSKPYISINADASTGERARNWTTVPRGADIENIRGKENTVSLDTTGFQFFRRAVPHTTFENDEVIEKEYYPQSIDLVKELTGASRVVVFDHSACGFLFLFTTMQGTDDPYCAVISDPPPPPGRARGLPAEAPARATGAHRPDQGLVHCPRPPPPPRGGRARSPREALPDRQPLAAYPPRRARLPARALRLPHRRPRERPRRDHTPVPRPRWRDVQRQVQPREQVEVRPRHGAGRVRAHQVVRFPADMAWYYRGADGDYRRFLWHSFDSQDDGKTAIFTPHTAFEDSTTPKDAPLRESIELRLLVFYD